MCSALVRLRRNCGGIFRVIAICCCVLAGITHESSTQAGALKNSVRVGDRSRMNLARPPSAGSRKRIRLGARNLSRSPRAERRTANHGWFWEAHPPTGEANSLRWEEGLGTARARRARGLAITSSKAIATIASRWRDLITIAARKHDISETLLLAVITAESAGKVDAKSHKGAQGLMQLIPATAARFGVRDPYDPTQNIDGGAAYLSWLLRRFNDDPILALAGYNAGENAIDKHAGVPPFTETRDYVPIVFDALAAAEALCLVVPSGPRRSCIWRETGS